ncbi:MAG: S-adenosylmethionine:tRNA ribosyltransferase-isomerase [Pirellulales bacterium]
MHNDSLLFDYEVPKRLVAQEPLRHRADARLMFVDRRQQTIEHHHVRDLPHLLPHGDRLVLNDTKVIPAHLAGRRAQTGGRWQGLFLESTPEGHWRILCKTRGRLTAGEAITLIDREGRPGAKLWLLERLEEGLWLVHPESDETTDALLVQLGRVPLPPYIRGGNMVDADVANYQTVFAERPGAIAAPTAGLHFTKELLKALEARGVANTMVTLHVGLGTFRPIEAETLDEHRMHSESGEITAAAAAELNATRAAGGRLIAVGTTVARLLETAVRSEKGEWERGRVGEREISPQAEVSPSPPLPFSPSGGRLIPPWQGTTDLFIRPPFEYRAIDALLTNFHFPRTTLLLLVQTFAGWELTAEAYRQAMNEEYRFYSYGDAMLII